MQDRIEPGSFGQLFSCSVFNANSRTRREKRHSDLGTGYKVPRKKLDGDCCCPDGKYHGNKQTASLGSALLFSRHSAAQGRMIVNDLFAPTNKLVKPASSAFAYLLKMFLLETFFRPKFSRTDRKNISVVQLFAQSLFFTHFDASEHTPVKFIHFVILTITLELVTGQTVQFDMNKV